MKHLLFILASCILFSCSNDGGEPDGTEPNNSIKDGDGNIYTENIIGNQIWLKEDLKTTKYYDGGPISESAIDNKGTEGFYYAQIGIDFSRLCPKGYKIPSRSDFEELIDFFGGTDLPAETMKDKYVKIWNGNPNGNGEGINDGSGLYWTSTESSNNLGKHLFYFNTTTEKVSASSYSASKQHIKCLKK